MADNIYSQLSGNSKTGFDFSSLSQGQVKYDNLSGTNRGLTQQDVINDPDRMAPIRDYMIGRKGVHYEDKSSEEVLDDYVSHMRWVNGNELSLFGEIRHTNLLTPEQRERSSLALQTYQEMDTMFEEGLGETLEGLWDYGAATLSAPSTYLGVGAGAVASKTIGRKAGLEALKAMYKHGSLKGVQKIAAKKAIDRVGRNVALKSLGVASATDAAIGAGSEHVYQKDFENPLTGNDYSPLSTALVGGLSGLGSFGLGAPVLVGKGKGVGITPEEILDQRAINKAAASGKVAPKVAKQVGALAKSLSDSDWAKAIKAGEVPDLRNSESKALVDSFFDLENPDSIASIFSDAGVRIDFEDDKMTSGFIGYIRDMAPQHLQPIKDAWEQNFPGVSFEDGMDQLAASMSGGGQIFSKASKVKQELGNLYKSNAANPKAARNKLEVSADTLGYIQNLWKRAVVSALPTTMVNVKGWGMAYGTGMADDALQIFTRPTLSIIDSITDRSLDPTIKALNESGHLARSLRQQARNIMDPMGTVEAFEAAWNEAPSKIKYRVSRDTFAGVATKDQLEQFHIPVNEFTKGVEGLSELASKVSMIDIQDRWTRAISGMAELDKQTRKEFGKSYAQLIRDGEEHLLTDEIFNKVADKSLKDTFSFDYGQGKEVGNKLARLVQGASNTPILGFAIPFGKFMNNSLAFTLAHSPMGLFRMANQMMKGNTDDAAEAMAKVMFGSGALLTLGKYSYDKMQEEGAQWYDVNGSDRQNLAPASQYLLMGRMYEMWMNGDPVPQEMWKDLSKQLTVGEYADVVSGPAALAEFVNAISQSSDSERTNWDGTLQETAKMLGGIGAGFTRPLELPNDLLGQTLDMGVKVDRRQALTASDRLTQELTRYVDVIMAPLLGEPVEGLPGPVIGTPARDVTRPEGDMYDPNAASTQFGNKKLPPKNHIDKLLGMVNFPPWLANNRGANPAFDRFLNEEMAPELNEFAKRLMDNPTFQDAPLDSQISMVRKGLSAVRKSIVDKVEEGQYGQRPMLERERSKFGRTEKSLRRQAKEEYDMGHIPDRQLTFEQLEILNAYIDIIGGDYKSVVDALSP